MLNTGSQPDYTPSPVAIWKKTREIRRTWTQEERARRRRFLAGVELPGIRICDTTELRRLGVNVGAE
jgi:hypothetical protein